MTPGAEGSTDVTSWVYKNQQYQFPWQPRRRAGSEHHGPPSPQRCGKALGDSSRAKQCPHCSVALGKRMELGRGGCWVWSHESHPCSQTHSPELPAGQDDALFCWIPPFPRCAPQGQMVSRGIQSLGTFPGGAAMDGGTCCETLRPQRSIAQHKAIYITIKGAYRLELVTLKCLSRSINWVTKYVNASVLYRQRKFLH